MAKRVIIRSGAGNPMRVSVSGFDADTAGGENLIFNGNQAPLRRFLSHYTALDSTDGGNLSLANIGPPAPLYPTPPGTYPLFCIVGFPTFNGLTSLPPGIRPQNAWSRRGTFAGMQGFGGVITSLGLHGINYSKHSSVNHTPAYINFLVFRNHG